MPTFLSKLNFPPIVLALACMVPLNYAAADTTVLIEFSGNTFTVKALQSMATENEQVKVQKKQINQRTLKAINHRLKFYQPQRDVLIHWTGGAMAIDDPRIVRAPFNSDDVIGTHEQIKLETGSFILTLPFDKTLLSNLTILGPSTAKE